MHRLTLCSFKEPVYRLPELPVSLLHLVLDGRAGVGPDCEPPYSLELGGLTRLKTLSLLGCAVSSLDVAFADVFESDLTIQPLPPSLRTLRLEAPELSVDLSRHMLSTASDLTLETSVGVVACDIGFQSEFALLGGTTLLSLSTELPDEVRSSEATSLLPVGVRILNMEVNVISIACAYMPTNLLPEYVRKVDAIHALCELFSTAPDSYCEFRLRQGSSPTLGINLL